MGLSLQLGQCTQTFQDTEGGGGSGGEKEM